MTKQKASSPTCGRCGVYRHLHPTARCSRPRLSFWWDRHLVVRHIVGVAWLALPQRWRWAFISRVNERRPELCWCDLVDCALLDDRKRDFRGAWGCGCDVPVPWEVREPTGDCYCEYDARRQPAEQS